MKTTKINLQNNKYIFSRGILVTLILLLVSGCSNPTTQEFEFDKNLRIDLNQESQSLETNTIRGNELLDKNNNVIAEIKDDSLELILNNQIIILEADPNDTTKGNDSLIIGNSIIGQLTINIIESNEIGSCTDKILHKNSFIRNCITNKKDVREQMEFTSSANSIELSWHKVWIKQITPTKQIQAYFNFGEKTFIASFPNYQQTELFQKATSLDSLNQELSNPSTEAGIIKFSQIIESIRAI